MISQFKFRLEKARMSVDQSSLDAFYHFASEALDRCGPEVSMEDLVRLWQRQTDREATLASVLTAIDAAAVGRIRDASEVDAAIRMQLGFPPRN
jgi:hypothetical protein